MSPKALLLLALAAPADGPRFLGPERNGSTTESGVIESGKETGRLRKRWKVEVGEGFSSVVPSGGRVFSMDADGATEYVFALDQDDGALEP
jgi:hypothetical protein